MKKESLKKQAKVVKSTEAQRQAHNSSSLLLAGLRYGLATLRLFIHHGDEKDLRLLMLILVLRGPGRHTIQLVKVWPKKMVNLARFLTYSSPSLVCFLDYHFLVFRAGTFAIRGPTSRMGHDPSTVMAVITRNCLSIININLRKFSALGWEWFV